MKVSNSEKPILDVFVENNCMISKDGEIKVENLMTKCHESGKENKGERAQLS